MDTLAPSKRILTIGDYRRHASRVRADLIESRNLFNIAVTEYDRSLENGPAFFIEKYRIRVKDALDVMLEAMAVASDLEE